MICWSTLPYGHSRKIIVRSCQRYISLGGWILCISPWNDMYFSWVNKISKTWNQSRNNTLPGNNTTCKTDAAWWTTTVYNLIFNLFATWKSSRFLGSSHSQGPLRTGVWSTCYEIHWRYFLTFGCVRFCVWGFQVGCYTFLNVYIFLAKILV